MCVIVQPSPTPPLSLTHTSQVVLHLLSYGADTTCRDQYGKSAHQVAKDSGRARTAQWLRRYHEKDANGQKQVRENGQGWDQGQVQVQAQGQRQRQGQDQELKEER